MHLWGFAIESATSVSHVDAVGSYRLRDVSSNSMPRLFLLGENFGEFVSELNITFEGVPDVFLHASTKCTSPTWHSPTKVSLGRPFLSCHLQPTAVGRKLLFLTVAHSPIRHEIAGSESGLPLVARCGQNFYGNPGELCVECWHYFGQNGLKIYAANCTGLPQGDTYDGATKAPVARDGFAIDPPPECLSGQCNPGPARGGV